MLSLSGFVLGILVIFAISGVPAIANDATKTRATVKVAQLLQQRTQAVASADGIYTSSYQTLDDLHRLAASVASAYTTFNFGVASIIFPDTMHADVSQLIASDEKLIGAAQQMTQATFQNRSQLAQSYSQAQSEQQAAQIVVIRDLQVGGAT
jgi:hypothetical protein